MRCGLRKRSIRGPRRSSPGPAIGAQLGLGEVRKPRARIGHDIAHPGDRKVEWRGAEQQRVDVIRVEPSDLGPGVVRRNADDDPLLVTGLGGPADHRVEGDAAAGQRRSLREEVEDTHEGNTNSDFGFRISELPSQASSDREGSSADERVACVGGAIFNIVGHTDFPSVGSFEHTMLRVAPHGKRAPKGGSARTLETGSPSWGAVACKRFLHSLILRSVEMTKGRAICSLGRNDSGGGRAYVRSVEMTKGRAIRSLGRNDSGGSIVSFSRSNLMMVGRLRRPNQNVIPSEGGPTESRDFSQGIRHQARPRGGAAPNSGDGASKRSVRGYPHATGT